MIFVLFAIPFVIFMLVWTMYQYIEWDCDNNCSHNFKDVTNGSSTDRRCQSDPSTYPHNRQAIWDAYGILGFDTDGDPVGKALQVDWPDFLREFATEIRKELDER